MKRQSPPLSYTGPSILEQAWEMMDKATTVVMDGDTSDKAKYKAIAISEVLAIFVNPYDPNPRAIREEAKRRYREGQEQ